MRLTRISSNPVACFSLAVASLVLAATTASPVAANIILSTKPVTLTAIAGSTDNAFDVTLTNSGPDVTIASFAFGLSVTSSDIVFTEATTATSDLPYIFFGSSLADDLFFSIVSTTPPPTGQSLIGVDVCTLFDSNNDPVGITLFSGDEVGLGRVFFDVLPSAQSQFVSVTFSEAFEFSNLTDPDFVEILIDEFDSSLVIQIQGSNVVPEPTSFVAVASLSLMGIAAAAWKRRRKR